MESIRYKKKITYSLKCLKCDEIKDYILRDISEKQIHVNPMSDSDVLKIINNKINDPFELYYCDKCKMHTTHLFVGVDFIKEEK